MKIASLLLLIHASGNDGHDTQKNMHYPSKTIAATGTNVNNWLEVGAVSWKGHEELVATFSNFGKTTVDIFAPGVDIKSTAPDQDYQKANGTSMAAPVTTGVAALVMSYFPGLSAEEVKDIILKSAVSYRSQKVNVPGKDEQEKFGQLSQTGGVINAYEAVKLAQKSRPKGKPIRKE